MGVKFGTGVKSGTWRGPRSHPPCQISPPSVQRLGYRTPKTEILLRFDQNVEYKRPAGAYPLRDFHKICIAWTPFQDALAVKILLDLLKGYGVMGVLSWRGLVIPKFSAPSSGKTMYQTPKSFRGARTSSRSSINHHAKFGGVWISFAAVVAKNVEFFVCLFVCPSCFWTSEIVRPISPCRRWSTETILMPLDRGRFVVVHPCSTLSDCCQLATTLNAEVQKAAKIGVFRQQRATD